MKALYLILCKFRSFFIKFHFGDNLLSWNLSPDALFTVSFLIRRDRAPWYKYQEEGPFFHWYSHSFWKDHFSCGIIQLWVRRYCDLQIMFCWVTYRNCWSRCPWTKESSVPADGRNRYNFFSCSIHKTFCLSVLGKCPIMALAYFENMTGLHYTKFSRNLPPIIHSLFSHKGWISIYMPSCRLAEMIFKVFFHRLLVPSILSALKNKIESQLAKSQLKNGKIFSLLPPSSWNGLSNLSSLPIVARSSAYPFAMKSCFCKTNQQNSFFLFDEISSYVTTKIFHMHFLWFRIDFGSTFF